MSGRLARLYRRYMRQQLTAVQKGPALAGSGAGGGLGLRLAKGRLTVAGPVDADRVTLELGGQRRSMVPMPRGSGPPRVSLTLPYVAEAPRLILERAGQSETVTLPRFAPLSLALRQLALWPGFGWRLLRALPAALNWLRSHDPAARDRVKRILDLVHSEDLVLSPAIFTPAAASHLPSHARVGAMAVAGQAAAASIEAGAETGTETGTGAWEDAQGRALAEAAFAERTKGGSMSGGPRLTGQKPAGPKPAGAVAGRIGDEAEARAAGDPTGAISGPLGASCLAGSVTILLPVYQAHDLLCACLDHLARHSEDLPWRLILIEDGSPDPRILPLLEGFVRSRPAGQALLLRDERNLGFIGAVNRGLAAALEPQGQNEAIAAPIVLLNSDALVPPFWLGRLIAPILADPEGVASVTPMSNDAELATVPRISARLDLLPGEALAIDRVAAGFAPGQGLASAPTGVGFCMALNRRFLALEPQLDPAFGRGYGEEVDWCQKVARCGGRHVYVPNLFVEHRGGSSFGSAEKQRLLAQNAQLLNRRYPGFDLEVQHWLEEDPLITPRFALGLALLAARAAHLARRAEPGPKPETEPVAERSIGPAAELAEAAALSALVPVYLGHSLGGGADHWLSQQLAKDVARQGGAVVLRIGGALRWRLELHGPTGVLAAATEETALVKRLLRLLPRRRVVYSCGVGDPDPVTLPQILLDLAQGPEQELELLLHDYFPLSPAYTLLDREGRYNGLPDPRALTSPTAQMTHSHLRPDGSRSSLAEWRAAWDALAARADRVVVFSPASRALALQAWPDLGERLVLRPHQPQNLPRRLVPLAVPRAPAQISPRVPRQIAPSASAKISLAAAPAAAVPDLFPPQPQGEGSGALRPASARVIGVPGNINLHKGAPLLVALARLLARPRADLPPVKLVVIGDLDPAYSLARPAVVHGPYQQHEFAALARRYGISDWLIPSLWPETFSYTTHEALATGLPVWCFDLGAQADAVRAAVQSGAPGGLIALGAEGPNAQPSRQAGPHPSRQPGPPPNWSQLAARVLERISGSEDRGDSG